MLFPSGGRLSNLNRRSPLRGRDDGFVVNCRR